MHKDVAIPTFPVSSLCIRVGFYCRVAAIGHNCLIYSEDEPQPVGGTSCSAPVVAGVFSLLNQVSLNVTGKPLGFMNPMLYAMFADNPSIFHDVTSGDNKCTEAVRSLFLFLRAVCLISVVGLFTGMRGFHCVTWMGPGLWTGHAQLLGIPEFDLRQKLMGVHRRRPNGSSTST